MGHKLSKRKLGSTFATGSKQQGGEKPGGTVSAASGEPRASLTAAPPHSPTHPTRGNFRYHFDRDVAEDYASTKKVLGTGLNGVVKVCVELQQRKRSFALKSVEKPVGSHSSGQRLLDFLRDEIEVYLTLDHPHIAKLHDVYESDSRVHFVMELCRGGELYSRLTERSVYTECDARETTRQMLLAVTYLHENKVVHRDIKLENFLYEDDSEGALLKLIDFGFAKHLSNSKSLQVSCGSMTYVAPEVLDRKYDMQCDMWSLGVTSYILLFGWPPFQSGNDKELRAIIRAGKYVTRNFSSISADAQDFLRKTLVVDPAQRLHAAEALRHPWLAEKGPRKTVVPLNVLHEMKSFAAASSLRRACLGVAVHCVSSEETKALRELFLRIDVAGNGTIRLEELRDAIMSTVNIEISEIDKLFDQLDQYKDEQLNYSEFLAATLQGQLRAREAAIRATFDRFDTDHSGYITQDNIREILGDSVDAAALIAEADRALDGRIDYGEFLKFLTEDDSDTSLSVTKQLLGNEELEPRIREAVTRHRDWLSTSARHLAEGPEEDDERSSARASTGPARSTSKDGSYHL